jgi:chromosome segregation ATPase
VVFYHDNVLRFSLDKPMTTTDKSPLDKLDHPCRETCSGWQQGYDSAYLAVKEELDAARMDTLKAQNYLGEKCNSLQQELEAARAEIEKLQERDNRMRDCPACGESYTHLGDKLSDINAEILKNHYEKELDAARAMIEKHCQTMTQLAKQLADAKAEIVRLKRYINEITNDNEDE